MKVLYIVFWPFVVNCEN